MSDGDNAAVAVIIILMLVFLIPVGWIFLAYPAEPYHVVAGEPLREAAEAAGVNVISSTDVVWPLPGALGGKAYVLGDNAGNTLVVQTQRFDNAQSRDVAILTLSAQSAGKGKTIGTMVVVGDHIIYISPDTGGILSRIGSELKKKQMHNNPSA